MADIKAGLTDMKRTQKEIKESNTVGKYKPSPYSYGTNINLNTEELTKLGVKELPEMGDEFRVIAVAKVTHASRTKSEHGEESNMSLQITHMVLSKSVDNEEKESKSEKKSESLRSKPNALTMR